MQSVGSCYQLTRRERELLNSPGMPWLLYITDCHLLAQNMECLLRAAKIEYVFPYDPDADQVIYARCAADELHDMQAQAIDFMEREGWMATVTTEVPAEHCVASRF